MRFSVVEFGYDRGQVDSCLEELGVRLTRLAARAESLAGAGRAWDEIRQEATHLCDVVELRRGAGERAELGEIEREAAEILAQARFELEAAREEARQVRERVYAEAVRARRAFEAALAARRRREDRVDEILAGPAGAPVPADTPTAAAAVPPAGVPTTRAAAGAADAEPPSERGTRVA
ncbi:ATPase [Micromonospora olivasterospora]|uniref:ATPase n=1 Tax=Micromonospora olivasterospora TaxID=1880 RepID=UPI0031D50B4F